MGHLGLQYFRKKKKNRWSNHWKLDNWCIWLMNLYHISFLLSYLLEIFCNTPEKLKTVERLYCHLSYPFQTYEVSKISLLCFLKKKKVLRNSLRTCSSKEGAKQEREWPEPEIWEENSTLGEWKKFPEWPLFVRSREHHVPKMKWTECYCVWLYQEKNFQIQ